ncbi:MAG: aldehyde ferredoxin oxidoreductase C-terminal domain-containing protein, partial [Dehalococcoidia bacterium]|nr:aldehyde ferredoxin oxidoreductase C-terminal domain-containing protein [Dehalococcoidia bacterium]
RHGITPAVEAPSERYGSVPEDGPSKGKSIAPEWNGMLDNYYQLMGWDRQTGKPLPETLRRYGLDKPLADLW